MSTLTYCCKNEILESEKIEKVTNIIEKFVVNTFVITFVVTFIFYIIAK